MKKRFHPESDNSFREMILGPENPRAKKSSNERPKFVRQPNFIILQFVFFVVFVKALLRLTQVYLISLLVASL
jgi:hypothetical protein